MNEYNQQERALLLAAAKNTIRDSLLQQAFSTPDIKQYPEKLRQPKASFVTLDLNNRLRGCIGSLIAQRPLILDVILNAYNAAFKDPRFPAITLDEFSQLELKISVLSKPEPLVFSSEAELIMQIRPGIDGLILSDRGQRGTFLPSVWEQLPEPQLFLQHLKNKAGFTTDYWSKTLKIERYKIELIS